MEAMTTNELFERREFKIVMAALSRIDCNIIRLIQPTIIDNISDINSMVVAAYSLASPANGLKTLYYRENDLYCAVRFGELGINQREFHHDAIKDGSVDPFDYEKLFSRLLAMNRWIGTSSGQTFLAGDGTDIYKLEIDVDLRNDCF